MAIQIINDRFTYIAKIDDTLFFEEWEADRIISFDKDEGVHVYSFGKVENLAYNYHVVEDELHFIFNVEVKNNIDVNFDASITVNEPGIYILGVHDDFLL